MENVKQTKSSIIWKWTLIYLVTSIVVTYLFQYLDLDPNSSIKYVAFIPFLAFLLLTQKECKEQAAGYQTFGEGFSSGFKFTLFSTLLGTIFSYVYFAFLSPEVVTKILDATRAQMEEKGTPKEQIDTALEFMTKHGALIFSLGGALTIIIVGIIVALIGAAIFKKERSPFDMVQEDNYTDPVS